MKYLYAIRAGFGKDGRPVYLGAKQANRLTQNVAWAKTWKTENGVINKLNDMGFSEDICAVKIPVADELDI